MISTSIPKKMFRRKKKELLFEQVSINQSSAGKEKADGTEDGLTDGYLREQQIYSDVVRANIDFPFFADWLGDDEEAEEIVQMIVRQICSMKPTADISRKMPNSDGQSTLRGEIWVLIENNQ